MSLFHALRPDRPARSASGAQVEQLLAVLARSTPTVLLPGSEEYAAAVAPWNLAVAPRPLAVVAAERAEDVVAAVRFARRHRLAVTVQATGHGVTHALDGTILVSTRSMRGLQLHADGRWVRAQAGVTWDEVLQAGAPHGLAGLSGSAPGVGVVGYTTGGGHGPLARSHGLASDTVRAFEVVTGDGQLRRATKREHPDLYWGLRGGKGALGIVTAIELDLLPIRDLYAGSVWFDGADAPEVLRAWARWSVSLPDGATTSVAMMRLPDLPGVPPPLAGRLTVSVRFAWVGDPARGAEALAPLRAAASPLVDTVAVMPYAALGAIHADPVDPMPSREAHALLRAFPEAAVEQLLRVAGPQVPDCPLIAVEVRQLGGAVSRVREPSAVDHREAAYSLLVVGPGVPPVVDAVDHAAAALLQGLRSWDTGGRLPNFAPPSTREAAERAWSAPTRERLRRVSRAYDPRGVIAAASPLRR